MIQFLAICAETFLRLRRDQIFLPAAGVGCVLLLFSGLASYWGVEEFFKILYDLGTTAYLFTGATVGIFWGVKIINDSRQEGSLEVQLASPIGRVQWLLAKYVGLSFALILLSIIFLMGWQAIYSAYGMGFMGWNNVLIFSLLTLSWLVVAAIAILMSTISSYALALFSSVWMFLFGLLTAPLMQSMSPDTPTEVRQVMELLAGIWNLHLFNLYEYGIQHTPISFGIVQNRLAYAGALIALMLGLASWIFNRKDIAA